MTASLHYRFLPLVPALLPTYLLRFSLFTIPTNLLEVIIIMTALLGLASPSPRRLWRQTPRRLPLTVIILTAYFLLAAVVSTVIAPHLVTALGILKGWIIIPVLYAFMVSAAPLAVSRYLHPLLFSSLAVALYSFSRLGSASRLQAFYDTPNSLALVLAPLAILFFFSAFQENESTFYRRLYLSVSAILFLALLGTQSAGGLLAVLLTLAISLLILKKLSFPWSYWVPIIAILGSISAWALVPKMNYLLQPGSSAYVRLQLWSVSLDLIKDHPFTGIGLGAFEPAYQQQLHQRFQEFENCNAIGQSTRQNCAKPLPEFVFRDPHNWMLAFYLNLGPVGLFAFASLNFLALKRLYASQALSRGHKLALGATLAALLLHGLVDTMYWKNDLALLWWMVIAFVFIDHQDSGGVELATPAPGSLPQIAD